MNNTTIFVGMDVHKESFTLCEYQIETEKASHFRHMPADYKEVLRYLDLRMVQEHELDFYALSPDFFQENTRIERDKDFLLQLVNSNSKTRILVALLKFLCNTEESILDFAEIIYAVVKQAATLSDDGSMRIDMDEMVRCVAHLYDVGKDKPEILTICLDTWDELFKNNLHDIQALSTMLDDFN